MLDSIYQMICNNLKITFLRENAKILPSFTQHYNGCHYVKLLNL